MAKKKINSVSVRKKAKKGILPKSKEKRHMGKTEFSVLSTKVVPFTMKLATELEEMEEFVGERDLRELHVLYLATEMENGTFLWHETNLAVAKCAWDKRIRRVNGHHTSVARTLFDGMRKDPMVHYTVYAVRTEDEFRRLYSKFDRIAPRTRVHVGNIRLLGTPEFQGVTASVLNKLQMGHRVWMNDREYTIDHSCDDLLDKHNRLAHKVIPFIRQITNNNKAAGFLNKAAVYGALLETFHKCASGSEVFWDSVISGLNFSSEYDPGKCLRDWLIQYTIRTNNPKIKDKATVTSEMVYRACIMSFNKFRAEEPMKAMRVSATKQRPKAK